jgi:cold shock CspA family protein
LISAILIPSFLSSNEKGTILSLQGTFGFLRVEKTGKSVFFHKKNVFAPGSELTVGDTVLFDLILRRERGKEEAVNVRSYSMEPELLGAAFAGGEVDLPVSAPSSSEKKARRLSKKMTIVYEGVGLKPEWKS